MKPPPHFIPFAEFNPDSNQFAEGGLELVKNFLPLHGSNRPVPLAQDIDSQASDYPILSGFVHLLSEETGFEYMQPGADTVIDDGVTRVPFSDIDGNPLDPHTALRGTFSSDAEWITFPSTGADIDYCIELDNPRKTVDITAATFKLRWRYRVNGGAGNYSIGVEVGTYSDPTFSSLAVPVTDSVAGAKPSVGDEEWVTRTKTFGPIVEDPNDLAVQFTVNSDSEADGYVVPDADVSVDGWEGDGGETTNLYGFLNKSGGDDDLVYVVRQVGASSTETFTVSLPDFTPPPYDYGTFTLYADFQVSVVDVMDVTVTLRSGDTDIATRTYSAVAAITAQRKVITLTDDEYDLLKEVNFSNLELVYDFYNTSASTTVKEFTVNGVAFKSGTWATQAGGTSNTQLYQAVDEVASTATATKIADWISNSGSGLKLDDISFNTQNVSDPETDSGHTARVYCTRVSGTCKISVDIRHGGTILGSKIVTPTGSDQEIALTLDPAAAALITDYTDIDVAIHVVNSDGVIKIYSVGMEVPSGGVECRILRGQLAYPGGGDVDISWCLQESPLSGTFYPGDQSIIYVGTRPKLFSLSPPDYAFVDVTNAGGDYITEGGRHWDFCTWGNWILATNYVDPIQVLKPGDAAFSDLITSTDKPQGRFIAVIGAQLCVANINPDSYADGRPYHFWCSHWRDPESFSPLSYDNLSTIFPIVATEGGITALVGGEEGTLYQPNNIYNVRFVGLPEIFQFNLVSRGIGTVYPESVVKFENHQFFAGAGGFYKLENGVGPVTRIGYGKINKFVFDSRFETYSVNNELHLDDIGNASKIIGVADSNSQLIWWLIQSKDDLLGRANSILLYNPAEDRFSFLRFETPFQYDVSTIFSKGNVVNDADVYTRGVYLARWSEIGFGGTAGGPQGPDAEPDTVYISQLLGRDTLPSSFRTNTVTAATFQGASQDPFYFIEIQAIRPVFAIESGYSYPEIDFTIEGSSDHSMQYDVATRTVSFLDDRRPDLWVPLEKPLVGAFFKFTVDIGSMTHPYMKEFLGIQIDYVVKGRHRY